MTDIKNSLVDVISLSMQACKVPLECNLAYTHKENFIGRRIDGYDENASDFCLVARNAGQAVIQIQNYVVEKYNYGLFVWDGYRPHRATLDFESWAAKPAANDFELERKALHYPHISKPQLFEFGYVTKLSNHSFGLAIDLTLVDLSSGKHLDMATIFDYMDEKSHPSNREIPEQAFKNRMILSEAMQKFGFEPYAQEWWHFNFKEREVTEAMDFLITPDLKGLNVSPPTT